MLSQEVIRDDSQDLSIFFVCPELEETFNSRNAILFFLETFIEILVAQIWAKVS